MGFKVVVELDDEKPESSEKSRRGTLEGNNEEFLRRCCVESGYSERTTAKLLAHVREHARLHKRKSADDDDNDD
jgi:hypothetical protein